MIQDAWRWLRFNLWYFGQPPWDTQITPPELVEFAASRKPGAALDLGCGTGTNLAYLAARGWQVLGVDYALKAVQAARFRLARLKLSGQVQAGDVTRLDGISGPFDLVLDIGCYHSLPRSGRERYRAALSRLLAPGGSFLLYGHIQSQPEDQIGLAEDELADFARRLRLVRRQDSHDRRGRRAVWIHCQT